MTRLPFVPDQPATEPPACLRFGTSSWAYEGWKGLVYRKPYSKSRFAQDCLAEYAAYEYQGRRLFRTVGLDHSFYRPPTHDQLAHYAAQVPSDFHVCPKVWEEITIPAYANLPRYGPKAGMNNPRFLDAAVCEELVLAPTLQSLGDRTGPFIFEFQRFGLEPDRFLAALDRFFARLPAGPLYAVEVRHPAVLGARYHDLLKAHGVAHVYNHWTSMPPLAAQHAAMGKRFPGRSVVVRLLTPLGLSHADAVRRYRPYDRLVQPVPRMRADTLALIRQALAERLPAYLLVNNRAEGNAPLTIQALLDALGQPADREAPEV
ncbi:MAG: DUF72 domain-containing protein [Nitrospirota bacterium]